MGLLALILVGIAGILCLFNVSTSRKKRLAGEPFFIYSISFTKKADLKRALFVFALILILYFLFLSVFPGKEKILDVCALNDCVPGQEGDTTSGTCTAYGTCNGGPGWGLSGDGTGSCCGDDSLVEWVTNSGNGGDSPFTSTGNECCSTSTACDTGAGSCIASGSTSGAIPNKAYCSSASWYGGDHNSSDCTAVTGSASSWAIGGATDATGCCGDDTSEYVIAEASAADSPSPYNNNAVGSTCCSASTSCAETGTDVCTTTGSVAGAGFNKAYCGTSNTWNGGDDSQTACNAIMGTGNWSIGGAADATGCCGDDANEYNRLEVWGGSIPGAPPVAHACCTTTTDCVNGTSTCYSTGTNLTSVDANSDADYCNSGTWVDCVINSQCQAGRICYLSTNSCVSPDGFLKIHNLGITGIENISDEFTSIRTVLLEMNFTENSTFCRYINYDDPTTMPSNLSGEWAPWETCIRSKVWTLSSNSGNKTVYFQINYSAPKRTAIFNDSIYFNFSGSGLDTTPPSAATIVDGDYIGSNQSVTISWFGASDPESDLLKIPLRYQYVLWLLNGTTLDNAITTATSYTSNITSFNLGDGTVLYVNLTVINSAGLTAITTSDGVIIDLSKPILNVLKGTYYNISNQRYGLIDLLPSENTWVYANAVNFSWTGWDFTSFPVAYSYLLTKTAGLYPDNVPEGDIANFSLETKKTFTNLDSGKYYFYIKVKDEGGNWGNVFSVNFSIDSTPPSRPLVTNENRNGVNITYVWSLSSDPESSVLLYMLNLSNPDGSLYLTHVSAGNSYTFSGISSGDYNATVGAMDGAGIWKWSNQEDVSADTTPPVVVATPNRTVISNSPILKVWTDEQAVCWYNQSSGVIDFTYTNTTYHEAKMQNLANGKQYVTLSCSDMSGNIAYSSLNFTVDPTKTPNNLTAAATTNTFEDLITTIPVSVKSSGTYISGITSDRFTLQINGTNQDISVFDFGDGTYNITFDAPQEPGLYAITFLIDSSPLLSANLSVSSLYLSSTYSDDRILASRNTSHITYYDTGINIIGMASDEDKNHLQIASGNKNLSIKNVKENENVFIFNTKTGALVAGREDLLNSKAFTTKVIPSFGYQLDNTYIIDFILRYDAFSIQSNMGTELKLGYYNVLARNTVNSDGSKTVVIDNAGSDSEKTVVS